MVSSLSMNLPFIFRSSPPIALYDFIDIYGNILRLCCCCVLDEGVGVVQLVVLVSQMVLIMSSLDVVCDQETYRCILP